MSHAHVCDECKAVAPVDENVGWWDVTAAYGGGYQVLRMAEKAEYHFCSWKCMAATATRLAKVG